MIRRIYGGQVALRFEPSDDLSFLGRIMYQRTELDGFPLADSTGGGNSLSADDFTQERLFNIDEGGEDEWSQFAFNVDYQTDLGLFSSSTGYLDRDTDEVEDSSEFISFTLIRGILGRSLLTQRSHRLFISYWNSIPLCRRSGLSLILMARCRQRQVFFIRRLMTIKPIPRKISPRALATSPCCL